jgi:ATP-dependent Zn protease
MSKGPLVPKVRRRGDRPAHSKEEEATAYHEAGHAVIALALRRGLSRVTIVPDDEAGSLGHCAGTRTGEWFQPDVDRSGRARRFIEDRVIILFAGFHAEHRFAGRRNHRGAASDWQAAGDLLSLLVLLR